MLHYCVAIPGQVTRSLYILPSLIYNSNHWDTSVYQAFLFISPTPPVSYSTKICLKKFLIHYTPFNKLTYFPPKHLRKCVLPLHSLSSQSLLTHHNVLDPSARIARWRCLGPDSSCLLCGIFWQPTLFPGIAPIVASSACFPCFSSSCLISSPQALGGHRLLFCIHAAQLFQGFSGVISLPTPPPSFFRKTFRSKLACPSQISPDPKAVFSSVRLLPPTQWVWANSGREWRTGKPGMLWSKRVSKGQTRLRTEQQQQRLSPYSCLAVP